MVDRAKLFTHGGSQAVRLPKAYRFEGKEVTIRKEGDAVVLEPTPTKLSGEALWAKIDSLMQGDEIPYVTQPTAEDVDRDW